MTADRELRVVLRSWLGNAVAHNIVSLMGVQAAGLLLPLVLVPYLARVLGPSTWGVVLLAQTVALYIAIIVEFGFGLSATREIAVVREHADQRAAIVAGVFGAKAVLLILSLAVLLIVLPWMHLFDGRMPILWAAIVAAGVKSLNVVWYFQGMESLAFVASLEVATDAVAVVATFFVVRTPSDAIWVLVIQALASTVSLGGSLVLLFQETPFKLPTWELTLSALRRGRSMFLFRGLASAYTTANILILGLLAPASTVAFYGGGERICKGLVSLMRPVTQALFPRSTKLLKESPRDAAVMVRRSFLILTGMAVVMAAFILVFAPILVRLALGPDYLDAITVLRILSVIAPLIAASSVLGLQWMLPLGLDRWLNVSIVLGAIVNLAGAFALVPRFGAVGMSVAVVAAETTVTAVMVVVLWMMRLDPFASTWEGMMMERDDAD